MKTTQLAIILAGLAIVADGCSSRLSVKVSSSQTPHEQMRAMVQAHNGTNFDAWAASDKAKFDALLAKETGK